MAALHRLTPRLLPFVILAIFVASFGYCVILTPIDPIGAFYLPWTRAWELALGALLAYREVFLLNRWPYPSSGLDNFGAALGVALIVGGYVALNEALPFPGWRAAIPTVGCALVIASPRSRVGEIALGNRVAGFFGLISYPLYLWHWPLFAFAHTWPGVIPTTGVMFALAVAAMALATLTWRFVEAPAASLFRRRPFALALGLVALLAATGIVGRVDLQFEGLSRPLPAARHPGLRLQRQRRRRRKPDAVLLSARRPRLSPRRGAPARRPVLRRPPLRRRRGPGQADDPHRRRLACGASFRRPEPGLRRPRQCHGAGGGVLRPAGRNRRDEFRASRERRAAGRSTRPCSSVSARSSRTCSSSAAISANTTTRRTGATPAFSTRWSPAREDCTARALPRS